MEVLDNLTPAQMLQVIEAELAKASNEIRCAEADIAKAKNRLKFALSVVHYLKQIDIKEQD